MLRKLVYNIHFQGKIELHESMFLVLVSLQCFFTLPYFPIQSFIYCSYFLNLGHDYDQTKASNFHSTFFTEKSRLFSMMHSSQRSSQGISFLSLSKF